MESRTPTRILFVCLGNICRSPAAEEIMRQIVGEEPGWEIDSAGTGNYHVGQLPDHRMRIHARRRGLELTHRCRQVSEADFENFDLIIGMDDGNVERLRRLAPTVTDERKVRPMADFLVQAPRYDHIPDPYYDGASGFELVLDLLTEGCGELYRRITEGEIS